MEAIVYLILALIMVSPLLIPSKENDEISMDRKYRYGAAENEAARIRKKREIATSLRQSQTTKYH